MIHQGRKEGRQSKPRAFMQVYSKLPTEQNLTQAICDVSFKTIDLKLFTKYLFLC